MNSLYQQIVNNQQPQQAQQAAQPTIDRTIVERIKKMANMINDSRDPQAVMNMLTQQNPQMAQFMQMANSSGRSLKEQFYQTARQYGVDPDAIVAAFN